ncbi:gas vesicle protein GvpO [Wenjunlia tyrosinilytica]|uniref:Gas vesicle protein n=1 Tax=Wenjunlia tyrosinilytica TaxID=1544741 RepID=A0A917ZSU5_9ACTN|nr:gas vesicle protein [Wenjunlia tyrosinilytica]GGO90234.1 gas vesicle protein [Wenjunlia tyrosinilytica]
MAEQRQARPRSSSATARPRRKPSRGPLKAAQRAAELLEHLISHPAEGVCAVQRTENGWCVGVDVLEVPRIPDTTSLLATYEVELDEDGELLGYRRVRRYRRGASDDHLPT